MKKFLASAIQAKNFVLLNQEDKVQDFTTKKMMEIMKGPTKFAILDSIDVKKMVSCLMGHVNQLVTKASLTTGEKNIVANALALLECCLMYKNELFEDFLKTANIDDIVMHGILYCQEENVRVTFHDTLRSLSRFVKVSKGMSPINFLLKLLSSNFGKISQY